MFDVVLYQPEIPQNAGNIMRLAANTGCHLHFVRPLGFSLTDRQLKRAGMDYRDAARVTQHESWQACAAIFSGRRMIAFTTRGKGNYANLAYRADDVLLFGPETRGLPDEILEGLPPNQRLRIPMRPESRSLNLANSVSIVLYEAWRQQGFAGSADSAPTKV